MFTFFVVRVVYQERYVASRIPPWVPSVVRLAVQTPPEEGPGEAEINFRGVGRDSNTVGVRTPGCHGGNEREPNTVEV